MFCIITTLVTVQGMNTIIVIIIILLQYFAVIFLRGRLFRWTSGN